MGYCRIHQVSPDSRLNMARNIESVHTFTHKQSPWSLEKEKVVVRCHDGAVYEFGKPEDEPTYRLIRRFQPDGSLSTSSGVLPSAVKETANSLFGETKWHK